jgi:CheY-like chemotaxis protein
LEAIEKIKVGKSYDIILLDHLMPDMDGIETIKHLRELGCINPIIAFSANTEDNDILEKFLANGFDAFLSKPIIKTDLEKLLNKYLKN